MTKLFSEFKAVNRKEWHSNIISNLNKFDAKTNLISNLEKIEIFPFYHQEDNYKTFSANFPKSWESYQLIDATEAKKANKRALLALKNDVSGLCFSNPNNLDVLLKDIKIEHIRIDFTKYHQSFPEIWKKYTAGKKIQGAFHGKEKIKLQNFFNTIFTRGETAVDQISSAYNQGKNELGNNQFYFDIGSNFFMEIAKLKAFRILWENKTGKIPFIFANTSLENKEEKQPYNNILRTTTSRHL